MKQILATLYDYNYWANALILEQAAKVSETQFTAPTIFSAGSLRATLIHTLAGEWIWRTRCQDGISPAALLDEADFPTLSAIIDRWQVEEKTMRAYLATLTDADLDNVVAYQTTSGKTHQQKLAHILHHVILHGMQHRSEMAAMLTEFGHSPGNIDFIVYLRRQNLDR